MDLIADIGNTRIHLALFEGSEPVAVGHFPADSPAALDRAWTALLDPHPTPTRVAIAHVNRSALKTFQTGVQSRLGCPTWVLGETLSHELKLRVKRPEHVGQDRIANGLWARATYPGSAAVVVDLGTAITFDVIAADGAFVGGLIAAGLRTAASALAERTAQLPQVELEPGRPPPVLGRTTEACLQAGMFWSAVGLIDAGCRQVERELGEPLTVVATGGDAAVIAPHCAAIQRVEPLLTLRGIQLALAAGAP